MAPDPRSHQKITWCKALCPMPVLARRTPMSSYLGRLSLCSLPKNELLYSSSTRGRMDPAGLEPASATWTECYVPITPRALMQFPWRHTEWQGRGSQFCQACPKLEACGLGIRPSRCVSHEAQAHHKMP